MSEYFNAWIDMRHDNALNSAESVAIGCVQAGLRCWGLCDCTAATGRAAGSRVVLTPALTARTIAVLGVGLPWGATYRPDLGIGSHLPVAGRG